MKISQNSRAQTISTDAIIAIVLFTIAIIFFFALGYDPSDPIERLERDSAKLSGGISCRGEGDEALLTGQKVNEDFMKKLASMSCEDLKRCLGLNNNVCIYFQDDEGNLVRLNESPEIYGIGCPGLRLAEIPGRTGFFVCGKDSMIP